MAFSQEKEEALTQAMAEAEDRFKSDDLPGAIRLAQRAHDLCPSLSHPSNLLVALRIHRTAARHRSEKQRSAAFWHAILGSKPTDTVDVLKRHYRRLSIRIHPDKNPSAAADGAFKLVAQAFDVLSANAASAKNAATTKSKASSARWKWKASSPEKKADGGSKASAHQAPRGPWHGRESEKAGGDPKREARKRAAAAAAQAHGTWYNCGGGTKIFVSSSSSSSSSGQTRVRCYVDANGEHRISIC